MLYLAKMHRFFQIDPSFLHSFFYHLCDVQKTFAPGPYSGFWGSGRPISGGQVCCLCLWRVPRSVKCVSMTCFALCLGAARCGLRCLCYSRKPPLTATPAFALRTHAAPIFSVEKCGAKLNLWSQRIVSREQPTTKLGKLM